MKSARCLLPLVLCFAPAAALADTAEAEAAVRAGNPAEALTATEGQNTPEAAFWRGRALVAMGRLAEAAAELKAVPESSPLFPYAAKALLYCAWQSPEVDLPATATPLTICRDNKIAALATAALGEHWLHNTKQTTHAVLDLLRNQASTQQENVALLHLLEAEELRRKGNLNEAEARCRKLEQERDLPTSLRHRARLALAEISYDREKEAAQHPEPEHEEEEADLRTGNANGTGEEILLHFISTNAESPLLPEAIRHLAAHRAFTESEYAIQKLREWSEDERYPRRASIALYIRQHLLNEAAGADKPLDATCVNTAVATCPQEPVTQAMVLEQARWLAERGQNKEAALYLQMATEECPLKHYLEARIQPQDTTETAQAYLACAAEAAPDLRRAALCNALLCALRAADAETAETVLASGSQDADALQSVILGFCLERGETEAAEKALHALTELTEQLPAAAALDAVALALLQGDVDRAREAMELLPAEAKQERRRLFALKEAYCLYTGADTEETLAVLRESAKGDDALCITYADRLIQAGRPEEALARLQAMLDNKNTPVELLPAVLYKAAHASERLGSPASLRRAAEMYEHCAAVEPGLEHRATIRRAAVLSRIGRAAEALELLPPAAELTDTPAEETVLHGVVRATALMLLGTEESRRAAAEETRHLLQNREQLPRRCQYMALLHHGAICSRLGYTEEALQAYKDALTLKSPTPETGEWTALYFAAAGAVAKCEQLEHFEEAAAIADTAADWQTATGETRSKQFRAWAQHLRQTHFLKSPQQAQ